MKMKKIFIALSILVAIAGHADAEFNLNQDKNSKDKMKQYLQEKYNINAKEACPDGTTEQVKRSINTLWKEHSQAMITGNLEKGFRCFSIFTQDEMQRRFSNMPKAEIKEYYASYESIEIYDLDLQDGVANGGVVRKEKSEEFSYPVTFMRDPDCVWRIRGY